MATTVKPDESRREGLRTLVLKGSEWLRGEGGLVSKMRRAIDGRMCCLGVLGVELGIPRRDLNGCDTPLDAIIQSRPWPFECSPLRVSDEVADAMRINDAPLGTNFDGITIRSDEERVEKLRPIFEEWGWALEWRPNE